ncbi:MAG: FtsW/RodA/SpoVE family cell cycle protein [Clostridia bacterium]|nr:FtsW/RodA/SpoVE family cell cycle protein [Clostridia bacterium]
MATNARRATAADNRPRTGWRKFIYTGGSLDTFFIMTLLLLLAIGLICLFSASYVYADYYDGDSYFYIKKQALFAVIGLVAMFGVSCIDYHVLHKFTWIVMGISLFLLVLVLFLPAPTGIHRWINLPLVGGFQPSELAKFAIILSFAHLISINHKQMKKFTVGYVPFVLILGVTAVLIIAEPHLSGTILVVAIGGIMMFVGGTRVGYLAATVGLAVGAVVLMVGVLGYEADRIMVWQDPIAVYNSGAEGRDLAWQTVQSLYAIGSGGLMGLGLGNSREKHLFLPEPQNDFIFSIVCEELGFVGAAIIIILFALLVWRGIVLSMRARDKFGAMLAVGICAQIGVQVVLNIAVVSNLMPNTGIGLPFFSYGGSSMMMLLMQMGVLLSVSRQARNTSQG